MSKEIVGTYVYRPEHKHTHYEFDLILYDTVKEMNDDKRFASKKRLQGADGLFVPASMNGSYLGSIRLAKDSLKIEIIAHECHHAAVELMHHIGICYSIRNEEKAARYTGIFTSAVLCLLKEQLIWD